MRVYRWLFPDKWSRALGEFALACLGVLIVTGVVLMFWYKPSIDPVVYVGVYAGLRGVTVSQAFDSMMRIAFEIPGGLLIRQTHHWASVLLNAAVLGLLARMFFGGLFKGARRVPWFGAVGLMLLSLAGGFTGYNLPDDMLSGSSMAIASGVVQSIPVVGTLLHALAFGSGGFPGDFVVKLYWIHVLPVPLAILGVLALVVRWARKQVDVGVAAGAGGGQKTAGRRNLAELLQSAGTMLIATSTLLVLGGTAQISPTWVQGPSDPAGSGNGSQPDWYLGFLDGGLRIFPNWEVTVSGYTLSLAVLVPGLVIPGILFTLLVAVPLVQKRFGRDKKTPNEPERPRQAATRTALGVAWLLLYGVLTAAAAGDIIATQFHLAVEHVVWFFRIAALAAPVVGYLATKTLLAGLVANAREQEEHGVETGIIVRQPTGGYEELVTPLRSRRALDAAAPPTHPDDPRHLDPAGHPGQRAA
ncbi:cytochrome b [Flindersiella endophytica]